MELQEVIYYVAIWIAGTVSGCFRAVRDGDNNGVAHLLSIGGVAGFLAVGVVAIGGFHSNGRAALGFGLACIVGALGREITDTILVDVAGAVAAKIRSIFNKDDTPEEK